MQQTLGDLFSVPEGGSIFTYFCLFAQIAAHERLQQLVAVELADERAAEDALIARAVERARGSAQALAAAAGSKLGGIKHISYNSRSGDCGGMYCAAMGAPDGAPGGPGETALEPEPIEVECSVDVEWWLE